MTLAGTPITSQDAQSLVFAATMRITGGTPELEAYGDKEIMLAVNAEKVSPDVRPDTPPDVTPDVPTTETTADEINNMTSEQLQEKFSDTDGVKITGNVGNLNELVEKISSVTEIKTLDLSEAENLEEVKLSGNSTIKSLTLAGNTTIKTIDVSGTKLAVLNADNCAGLTELRCANCSIEELDVEGCDSLEVLDCRNNKLHKLDAYMLESLYELLYSNQNITGWIVGREFDFMEYFGLKVSAADGVRKSDSGVGNVKNLKAWDANGNALTVNYDSGFEGVMMDVNVLSAGSDEPDSGSVSSSGGGCNAVFGNAALGMIAVMTLLAFRRKN